MSRMWQLTLAGAIMLPFVLHRQEPRRDERRPSSDAAVAALGKRIFFDSTLSASGRMSCSSCHNPAFAYGPSNDRAVQLGGRTGALPGTRAAPSLRYVLNRTPVYYKSYTMNIEERIREGSEPPSGGFGWDGRFNSLHEQAAFPLLAPNEMANAGVGSVVAHVRDGAYADDFRRVFGEKVLHDSAEAFARVVYAIERFELTDPSFHPYDSKYDLYLDGKAQLTLAEKRGLALFEDPRRGNCSSCHLDQKGADGSHPLFTDYQFGALGVPRNHEIAANEDPAYYDQGLCGPSRTDQRDRADFCGMFKTPTLRNVARRGAFFHNGRFHSLRDALRFYVRRDTDPQLWYPRRKDGGVDKFDDLPRARRVNVDVASAPLTKRRGEAPVWTDAEIDDVIAFLTTLNDGYAATVARP